ncbi:MAG TPA: hypothetical protein VHL78_10125 [Actinomycetota bacterium]|nr:hypothetical protein [Actinomycetota bacterium]
MPVDEQGRHQLYLKLEEVLGPEEAGILMDHLPPRGFGDLATKGDLELLRSALKSEIDALRVDFQAVEHKLTAKIESMGRRLVMWSSSMVLATGGLVAAITRLA